MRLVRDIPVLEEQEDRGIKNYVRRELLRGNKYVVGKERRVRIFIARERQWVTLHPRRARRSALTLILEVFFSN